MPMDASGGSASEASRPSAVTDTTAEFEEYTAPPRVDEHGRPIARAKGLAASGYQFPPPGGPQAPLTKANLAKGIGVPDVPRASAATAASWPVPALPGQAAPPGSTNLQRAGHASERGVPGTLVRQLTPAPIERPTPPPTVKVEDSELFEEYRRPDLDKQPTTGKGIRTEPPPPPSAKEILRDFQPAAVEPEVVTPKRFSILHQPAKPTPPASQDEQQAEIDARSDIAASPTTGMAMSNSSNYGPIKTVIHHDDDERTETLSKSAVYLPPESPGIKAAPAAPAMQPLPPKPGEAPVATPSAPLAYAPPVATPTLVGTPAGAAPSAATPASRPHLPDLPALGSDGPVPRLGIVQAQFNTEITLAMLEAAETEARRLGCPVAAILQVPGVYDTSLATKRLLARDDIDAVVVLGCVIQGETGHDELITHATAQTLLALACNADKPVALGITGPRMTRAQAEARIESGAFAVRSAVAQHRMLKTA